MRTRLFAILSASCVATLATAPDVPRPVVNGRYVGGQFTCAARQQDPRDWS